MKVQWALAFATLLAAMSAAAGDDAVLLTSGNRLVGEVQELSRGELQFSIDGAGSVDIDWRNVVELQSGQNFYVELRSGERFTGPLSVAAGQLTIVTTAAGVQRVNLGDVFHIRPASASTLAERLGGSVDGGFDFLSANDEIDWTVNASIEHRTQLYLTEASISSLLRRRNDTTAQRRNHFEIGTRRYLEQRWFVLGQLQLEEDRELDLDSRFVLGASLGRTISQSHRAVLAAYAGIDGDREKFRGFGTDTVFELHGAIEWDWYDVGGDNEIQFEATTYFSPDTSRVRLELQAALRRDIANDFYWSLRIYESYNSDPPGQFENSDLGVGITIGRDF